MQPPSKCFLADTYLRTSFYLHFAFAMEDPSRGTIGRPWTKPRTTTTMWIIAYQWFRNVPDISKSFKINIQIDQVSTLTHWKRCHLKFQPSFICHEPMALWHDILSYIDLTSLAMSCDVKVQHSWLERISRQLHFFWPDVHLGISGTLPGTACCQTQICHTSNNDSDPLLLHIG